MAAQPLDEVSLQVQKSLESSPYACTSLGRLSGGTANFLYRGTLVTPLEDGSKTVVVKHTEAYVASNPGFKLTDTRCDYEQTILASLSTLPPTVSAPFKISTPSILHFSPNTNTQIHSDLPSSCDLKTYALTHPLTRPASLSLGLALGIWTRSFHTWAAAPERQGLRESMKGNTAMRELKFQITYANLVATIASFPRILEGYKEVFQGVREDVRRFLDEQEGTLIHGDFWTGNVLLPKTPLSSSRPTSIYIIDWELSALGHIAFDLGQMFAELFELTHFKNIEAGTWIVEGFMEGYGGVEEESAFRVAVHVGTHLISWGSRGQGWGSREQVEKVVEIGRDWVVGGWKRERGVFKGGPLGCLFR